MNKKKILKIVLFIILLLVIIFAIHTIRNYIIVNKIIAMQTELLKSTNYSYVSESYTENDEIERQINEVYYKDKKYIRNMKTKNIYIWSDEETKEQIMIVQDKNIAMISKDTMGIESYIPFLMDASSTIGQKIGFAIFSFITSTEVNGEKCYVVNWGFGAKDYIAKNDGRELRVMNGQIGKDGKSYDLIVDYKEWKFNEIKDEDVARPELTGYEIVE